jgi:hypothetical protein
LADDLIKAIKVDPESLEVEARRSWDQGVTSEDERAMVGHCRGVSLQARIGEDAVPIRIAKGAV